MRDDWKTNNFDFLRLALAILVIYSHSYPLGTGAETAEPLYRATHGQMTLGAVAVDLFFVMSGFLIAASAERSRGVIGFLKKRVARIYPAFLVGSFLTLLFVLPISSGRWAESSALGRFWDFSGNTLRLLTPTFVDAFPSNPYPGVINGSIWSIPFEFWCYIGVALLLITGLLRNRLLLLGSFLVAVIVSVLFQAEGWILGGKILGRILGSPQLWARLLPLYLAGVVFYLFRKHIKLTGWGAAISLLALVLASNLRLGWTAIFPFAGTYLVFYSAFASWIRLNRFGRFGDFSYGTYLYAFPIAQIIMKWIGHPVSPATLFFCVTPPTLVLAIASWYGVERHFLGRSRKGEDRGEARDLRPLPHVYGNGHASVAAAGNAE